MSEMDEFADLDGDPSPGPWFVAGLHSPCAHGDTIMPNDVIRATGDGEYEHQECTDEPGPDYWTAD